MNIAVASCSVFGTAALEALLELDIRIGRVYAYRPLQADNPSSGDMSTEAAGPAGIAAPGEANNGGEASAAARSYIAVSAEPLYVAESAHSELYETAPAYLSSSSDFEATSDANLSIHHTGPAASSGQADSEFEAPVWEGLVDAGSYVSGSGADWQRLNDDFARICVKAGIPLQMTDRINDPAISRQLALDGTDLLLVVGWPELLGRELLGLPPLGVVGLHASMLPEGRGAASIRRPILQRLPHTGVSIYYLNETVSGGDLLGQTLIPIHHRETSTTLRDKVMRTHKSLVKLYIPPLLGGTPPIRVRQDEKAAIRWNKEEIGDTRIDWTRDAAQLDRQVRAGSDPYPYMFTCLEEYRIYILEAYPLGQSAFPLLEPGTVAEADSRTGQLIVQTGEGMLRIDKWRQESRRPAIHIRQGCRFR